MLYYIPVSFVTVQLVLGVKSRWKGNVPGLCKQASKGLVHLPWAVALTGAGQLVNKPPLWTFGIGLSHYGRP